MNNGWSGHKPTVAKVERPAAFVAVFNANLENRSVNARARGNFCNMVHVESGIFSVMVPWEMLLSLRNTSP